MLRPSVFGLIVLVLAGATVAQEKKPAIGNFPFWSAPKREFSDQFLPGLNAALLLSPEQIAKLHDARRETIDSDALRAGTKKDPNLTDAQREAAQKLRTEALTALRVKVSNILTAEQRALIDQINALHLDIEKSVGEEFGPKLVASKGNDDLQQSLRKEMRDRVQADFRNKLIGILSPSQKTAFEETAAAEQANAGKGKK